MIDNTNLIPILATVTYPFGESRLETCTPYQYGVYCNMGGVCYSTLNGSGLTLWNQIGTAGGGLHGSDLCQYGANVSIEFDAIVPIV